MYCTCFTVQPVASFRQPVFTAYDSRGCICQLEGVLQSNHIIPNLCHQPLLLLCAQVLAKEVALHTLHNLAPLQEVDGPSAARVGVHLGDAIHSEAHIVRGIEDN